jgi:outer membrane lipoprotein-sorting protein
MKTVAMGMLMLLGASGVATGMASATSASVAEASTLQAKTAEEILTRYVEALGGEAKYRAITTRYVEGVVENTKTKSRSRLVAWQKAPNLIRVELESPGLNTFDQGYDGTIGWARDVRMARILEGDDLASLMESGDFYTEIEWKRKYTKMEVMPDSPFDGKNANVVKATTKSGKIQTLYFDPATGLLVGYADDASGASKKATLTIVGEYKEFAGIKFATRYVQRSADVELITTYRKVEMNATITTDFSMPPEVKAAIEEAKKNATPLPPPAPAAAPAAPAKK